MKLYKTVAGALAVASGVAALAFGATPASAAGDTGRYLGCAAHWRNTAAWNECKDSPGATLRLDVDCKGPGGYTSPWRTVRGSVDPLDRTECTLQALSAANTYR